MRTSKPIATISYNTEAFLAERLAELVRNHKISDWIYIKHTAEVDEKKDHIHLWIKPNTLLDTMDLQNFLKEPDISDPTKKPLGCIDFRTSQVDDFILYGQHFQPYLASKGEMREFCYRREDFRFCDEDTFEDLYAHAFKGSDWAKRYQMLQALNEGQFTPTDLILNGTVPLNQATQLNAFMFMRSKYGTLERGGHSGHEE